MHVRALARTFAVASMIAFASAAHAGGKPVIELFTSQGCSSCPAADALLGKLATGGNVIPLTLAVDYWDYLGWRDTLGRPENTARQKDYAKSFGSRSVYTPQAVVNGRADVNGADLAAIDGKLDSLADAGEGLSVPISVRHDGDSLVVETGEGRPDARAHVLVVYYAPAKPVVIDEGENGGRTITYWNAVSDVDTAGMWHGAATRYELPASEMARKGAGGCAILLQSVGKDGLPGPILGAADIGRPGIL